MHRILPSIIIMVFLWPLTQPSIAQGVRNKRKMPVAKTGNTETSQWWLAVKGGTNFTAVMPTDDYSVFSYVSQPSGNDNQKQYKNFTKPGLQFGFIISFEFYRSLSANFAPSYMYMGYEYDNNYRWYSQENASKNVSLNYNFETKLQYIDLPVYFKYELLKGKLKPYIQVGGFYDYLVDAIQNTKISNIDQASGAESEVNITGLSAGLNDHFIQSNLGIIGGAGLTYNLGNARFGLEVNYRYGLNNIVNVQNRFDDSQQVTGAFDVQDDLSLRNLEISLVCFIPLKFITSKDYIPL